ncbi:hypothetical protein JHK82_043666 [Glycine max]|nr:hypothetical protein JHK86_043551 [Glycine max]KAG5106696.1 hypothetical protein JHK82_043666 [Glycine max]KAG5117621.1 hypothetical protein JHK84_043734 [Glycine max]
MAGREAFCTIEDSLKEMDDIMFNTFDILFNNNTAFFSPSHIDILVVNEPMFASVPFFTSRIINRHSSWAGHDPCIECACTTGSSGRILSIGCELMCLLVIAVFQCCFLR